MVYWASHLKKASVSWWNLLIALILQLAIAGNVLHPASVRCGHRRNARSRAYLTEGIQKMPLRFPTHSNTHMFRLWPKLTYYIRLFRHFARIAICNWCQYGSLVRACHRKYFNYIPLFVLRYSYSDTACTYISSRPDQGCVCPQFSQCQRILTRFDGLTFSDPRDLIEQTFHFRDSQMVEHPGYGFP